MDTHWEHEPVIVKVYIDYRDPTSDTYRQIDVCEECAEENRRYLEEAYRLQLGEAARSRVGCRRER